MFIGTDNQCITKSDLGLLVGICKVDIRLNDFVSKCDQTIESIDLFETNTEESKSLLVAQPLSNNWLLKPYVLYHYVYFITFEYISTHKQKQQQTYIYKHVTSIV